RSDQGALCAGYLPVTGQPLQLVHGLTNVSRPLSAALRKRPTVRVDRDPSVDQHPVGGVVPVLFEEVARLAGATPSAVLDPAEHQDREPVVGEIHIDVVDPELAARFERVYDNLLAVMAQSPDLILLIAVDLAEDHRVDQHGRQW